MGCPKLDILNQNYPRLQVVGRSEKLSKSCVDVYPFGMQMPGRSISATEYRYGLNGQEKDDEIKGSGNSINYKFRMYDPRIGRFFAVDPLTKKFPELTPYQFASLNPIWLVEIEGLEGDEPKPAAPEPKIKLVQKQEIDVSFGVQAVVGGKGRGNKGLGIDFSPAAFNILKISISETIDLETGALSSDWEFDWFTGDVNNSVGIITPVGKFAVANKFQVEKRAGEISYKPTTQKTEYSFYSPVKVNVAGVPVKGSVTYTDYSTGKESVSVSGKASASFKFLLGISYSVEGEVEAEVPK